MDCVNHPEAQAKWLCETCDYFFCDECKQVKSFGPGTAMQVCPVCQDALSSAQTRQHIEVTPFWERLPETIKYPFREDGVVALISATLVTWFLTAMSTIGLNFGVLSVRMLLGLFLAFSIQSVVAKE